MTWTRVQKDVRHTCLDACFCASGVGENRMLAGIGHAGAMALLIRNCEFDFSRGEINIMKYSSLGLRVISAQSPASEA